MPQDAIRLEGMNRTKIPPKTSSEFAIPFSLAGSFPFVFNPPTFATKVSRV